jgi:hypothetical protein
MHIDSGRVTNTQSGSDPSQSSSWTPTTHWNNLIYIRKACTKTTVMHCGLQQTLQSFDGLATYRSP